MSLHLTYPDPNKSFDFVELAEIPNRSKDGSGYLLIAMVKRAMAGITLDRYVCFTNYTRTDIWIEKLAITRPKRWFAFEDTVKIESDEEFNELHSFLIKVKVLDGKKRTGEIT